MTQRETTILQKIGSDLGSLTSEFRQFREHHQQLVLDVYGVPGDREQKPGLMGDVAELKRNRRFSRVVWAGVWCLGSIAFGAILTALLRAAF